MDASARRVDKCACNDGFVFLFFFSNFYFFNKAQQRQHQGRRGTILRPSALVEAQFEIQQTNQLPARYGGMPAVAPTESGQS